jgi:N-acetylneuraminate synthase/N,N'-diacetyllegionaminate synthase
VSTGAATLEEVERAAHWLAGAAARQRLAFLQCVSSYPTPMERAELDGVFALRYALCESRGAVLPTPVPVGYSDHTPEVETGALAVRRGARILEKHFTLDRAAPGPDHAASLEPAQFAEYVRLARAAAEEPAIKPPATGDAGLRALKRVLDVERDVRTVSRQSIVARRALPAGHVLSRADLCCKRPGTGLAPFLLDAIVGKPLARAVERDAPLTRADINGELPEG